jgi:hypothetical protein
VSAFLMGPLYSGEQCGGTIKKLTTAPMSLKYFHRYSMPSFPTK